VLSSGEYDSNSGEVGSAFGSDGGVEAGSSLSLT
jgi:hypothetical protein